nr:hypothetical protein [Thermoleophilaceae bacterium]
RRMRRLTLAGLFLLLLIAAAQPASAATKPAPAKAIAGIKKLPRAARELPKSGRKKVRRGAKRALKLARRGRICELRAVLVSLPREPEKLAPALKRIDRSLFKDKRLRNCKTARVDATRATAETAQSTVNEGAPFDTPDKPGPLNKEESESEEAAALPPGPEHGPDAEIKAPVDPGADKPADTASRPRAGGSALTDEMSSLTRALGRPTAFDSLGDPLDPVVASSGNVVVAGGNAYLAFSDDGGRNFSFIDPTKLFPDDPDGGLCCDFQVAYVKSIDAFLLLEQYWCTVNTNCRGQGSQNRYRLAWAKPSDLVAGGGVNGWKEWTYITSPGGTNARWYDRPDMAVGSNFAYLTWNEFRGYDDPKDDNPKNDSTKEAAGAGATIMRIPLSALKPDGVANSYTRTRAHNDSWFLPVLAQSPATVAYAFRSISDSELTMMRWPESSKTITSDSVPHERLGTEGCKVGGFTQFCNDADGDKMSAYRLTGAARQNGFNGSRVWVALSTARRKSGDKSDSENRPNSRLMVINPSTKKVVESSTIGATGCSAGFTRLTASTGGEVAGSYMLSCADNFPNFRFALFTGTRRYNGIKNSVRGTARIGDYSGVAPEPDGKHFVAGANNLSASSYDVTFARFGRKSDPIPAAPIKFTAPLAFIAPPVTPAAKPDLIVSSLDPTAITIKNQGAAGAGASSATVGIVGQTPSRTVSIGSLAAGASQTVSYEAIPCSGGQLEGTADSGGVVDESNESNNKFSVPCR